MNNPQAPTDSFKDPAGFNSLKANFKAAVNKRLDTQTLEWLYIVPASIVIPAGEGADVLSDVKADAHFQCQMVTGNYTTLAAGPVDDGTNHCTVRISDASNDLRLMDSPVPLDLFLSPGRVLSAGIAGDPSNALFYPVPFFHTFTASGGILCEFQNQSDYANTVNLLFIGKKLRAR